eukprot:9163-Heterococcus_DN1.PRE.1
MQPSAHTGDGVTDAEGQLNVTNGAAGALQAVQPPPTFTAYSGAVNRARDAVHNTAEPAAAAAAPVGVAALLRPQSAYTMPLAASVQSQSRAEAPPTARSASPPRSRVNTSTAGTTGGSSTAATV